MGLYDGPLTSFTPEMLQNRGRWWRRQAAVELREGSPIHRRRWRAHCERQAALLEEEIKRRTNIPQKESA